MALTGQELCDLLKIDADQLAAWLDAGLPAQGKGKRRRFDEGEVRAWMKAGGIASTWAEVAAHFNRSERTIATWIRQGMPGKSGRPGTREGSFHLDEIQAWLDGRGAGPNSATAGDATKNQAQTRLTIARAEMAELELREKRGELVEAEELWRRLVRLNHESKAQLDQLPAQIVKCLGDKASPKLRARVRDAVRRTIGQVLATLALYFEREAEQAEAETPSAPEALHGDD